MTLDGLLIRHGRWALLPVCLLALLSPGGSLARPDDGKLLLVGSSGGLAGSGRPAKEEAALKTLKSFIKEETGLGTDIRRQKDWRELAEKLAGKKLQLGVFPGDEFAWAKAKYPKLEPLALGINVDRYPVAYVVAKSGGAATFADLKGKDVALPASSPHFLLTFLRQQGGKKPEEFFSSLKRPENVEDALDDVVDGAVLAAAVDKAGLEAFRRRKPGRFKQLNPVAKSEPFPPVVIAYLPGGLDDAQRDAFRTGLLGASKKERGRTTLTLFRLTGFETVPEDFAKVLAATQKAYPPEDDK